MVPILAFKAIHYVLPTAFSSVISVVPQVGLVPFLEYIFRYSNYQVYNITIIYGKYSFSTLLHKVID